MIDFSITPDDAALRDKVRAFVETKVIPYENDTRLATHGPTDELRVELNTLARSAGLLAPHVSKRYGGLGLTHIQRSIVFEAAGYSTLGPIALHCAAPDEGNMHMLEVVANDAQKERFLRPLAEARVRSCFAMTEPHPGAGASDALHAVVGRSHARARHRQALCRETDCFRQEPSPPRRYWIHARGQRNRLAYVPACYHGRRVAA